MSFLCKTGHLVRHSWQAGIECAKCKANVRAKEKRQAIRALQSQPQQVTK